MQYWRWTNRKGGDCRRIGRVGVVENGKMDSFVVVRAVVAAFRHSASAASIAAALALLGVSETLVTVYVCVEEGERNIKSVRGSHERGKGGKRGEIAGEVKIMAWR